MIWQKESNKLEGMAGHNQIMEHCMASFMVSILGIENSVCSVYSKFFCLSKNCILSEMFQEHCEFVSAEQILVYKYPHSRALEHSVMVPLYLNGVLN